MRTYEEIIKQAQESYSRFFRNVKELPSADEFGEDVVLNTTKIKNIIAQAEGHMEALKAMKKELETSAKDAMAEIYPEAHKQIDDMSKSYEDAIEDLTAKMIALKNNA